MDKTELHGFYTTVHCIIQCSLAAFNPHGHTWTSTLRVKNLLNGRSSNTECQYSHSFKIYDSSSRHAVSEQVKINAWHTLEIFDPALVFWQGFSHRPPKKNCLRACQLCTALRFLYFLLFMRQIQ